MNKQRLYIYERKEIITLILLIMTLFAFAFTLGIHFGKQVGTRGLASLFGSSKSMEEAPSLVKTVPDQMPNKHEFTEQSKGNQQTLDETMDQDLREEVTQSEIKLSPHRQVHLPENPKTSNAGATTPHKH